MEKRFEVPKNTPKDVLNKIGSQVQTFYKLVMGDFSIRGLTGEISLRESLEDIANACKIHCENYHPELGNFALKYNANKGMIALDTDRNNPAKDRLEKALSYAISSA